MEFRQILYFVTLAHELHFAHAAAKLGITQPPLSRCIRELEKELGGQLFDRSCKWDVRLTEAGKEFLAEVTPLLPRFQAAARRFRSAAAGECGHLTVGAISSMIGHPAFIDTLTEMRKLYPQVVVEIADSTSGALSDMLKQYTVDLALMRLAGKIPDTEAEKLYDDPLVIALPVRHRLARQTAIPVAALKQERFISVPERVSGVFRNYIFDLCRKQGGFTPVFSHEISNNYTALRLTAAGAGITIVSAAYQGVFSDRLVYRPFSDFPAMLPMYAVRPVPAASMTACHFLQIMRKQLGKIGQAGPDFHQQQQAAGMNFQK